MATKQTLIALAFSVALATAAQAECLTDAQAADMVAHYVARTPAANPENLSDADGACSRAKLNQLLAQRVGKVIGYKAGLTNPAVQKRFNTDKPVWGKLYEGMVLQNGATVDAAFGARPLYEADMLVRVKSAAINHARTPMDVLEAVDQIIPFIELPDLMVQAPPRLNGAGVSAINVGARLGVAGQPIAVPATRGERYALLDALERMQVHCYQLLAQLTAVKSMLLLRRGHLRAEDVQEPLQAATARLEAVLTGAAVATAPASDQAGVHPPKPPSQARYLDVRASGPGCASICGTVDAATAAVLDAAIDDAFPGSRLHIDFQAGGRFAVELRQEGLLRPLSAAELSDGTLRYLLLVAALLPTSGSILVDGQPLLKTERQLKAQLGYLPQDFGYYPGFTGEEFLWYMGALKGLPKAQARRRVNIRLRCLSIIIKLTRAMSHLDYERTVAEIIHSSLALLRMS